MRCPYCSSADTKVTDSRDTDDGASIRRRRQCLSCGRRFTTYETVEQAPLRVIKKDGTREVFNRNKLRSGLIRACEYCYGRIAETGSGCLCKVCIGLS